jgi:hypothetical protein
MPLPTNLAWLMRACGLMLATLLLSGCSAVATYKSEYVSPTPASEDEKVTGRVLIYMPDADQTYVYKDHPTSFTGGANTLSLPFGLMTREISLMVFGDIFTKGATIASQLPTDSYMAIVQPNVTNFKYGYPQLKNLGFAITPEASMSVQVKLLDAAGAVKLEKTYDSGNREGKSYMLSTKPEERVSQLAHQELYDMLRQAAADIRTAIIGATPDTTPTTTIPAAATESTPDTN